MPGSNRIEGALLSCSASLGVDISGSGSILIRATNEDGVFSAILILLHGVGVGVVVVLVGVVVVRVGVVVVLVGVGVGVTVVVECLFLPAALTFLAAQKSEGTQNDWSSLKQKS